MTEEPLPAELAEAIEKVRTTERSRHYRMNAMVDDIERALGRIVRKVRSEGIVVISKYDADDWKNTTTVDVFAYLEKDMAKRGRPYIKCLQYTYGQILMWVPNSNYTQGLVTQLLFVAQPQMGWLTLTGRRKHVPMAGDILVYKSPKQTLFVFNGDKGKVAFEDWKDFVTTDRASRIRLGLKGDI